MRTPESIHLLRKRLLTPVLLAICLFFTYGSAIAQYGTPPPPPRPITVTSAQGLSFGTFYQGASGGTVTINSAGTRTSGGTVVVFTGAFNAAVINVYSNPGTLFSFILPITGTLSDGSGHSLTIDVDVTTNPVSTFVNSSNNYATPTQIPIGGTLTIGAPAAAPPGTYTGTFNIIFVEQ